jgi:His/Glu/Gln/Arg/opine family amino acid ABC transporter permease subunit
MIEFVGTLLSHAPEWLSRLRPALGLTILLTLTSFAVAIGLALLLELGRVSRSLLLRRLVAAHIDIFRSVPILAVLYLVYFGLPGIGIAFSAFTSGTIGLGLVYSAYLAEVLRAGVQSLHRGQSEAALAVGLTPFSAFRWIILPQAVRTVTPPLLVALISLLKDTSICALVAVNELMLTSKLIMSEYFLPLHIFVLVGLIYFAVAWPMSLFVQWIDRVFTADAGLRKARSKRTSWHYRWSAAVNVI